MFWSGRSGQRSLPTRSLCILHTADFVRSARYELKSGAISNQAPDPEFPQWLDQVEELADRNENMLGGPEACARFRQEKQVEYLPSYDDVAKGSRPL